MSNIKSFNLLYVFIILNVISILIVSAQTPSGSKSNPFEKEVVSLTNKKIVKDAFLLIDNLEPTTRKEHIELTEVPAPPFKEEVRAKYYKKMLEAAGPDKVWIDSMGNVLALRKGKIGSRTVVLDAHLDTVFPEETDVTVKMKGDTLYAPGIADDTRGLITILAVLKVLEKAGIETNDDVLFVGSVGEEGLGDVRGVKYIIEKSKLKVNSWIAIDGTDINKVVNGGLGVIRYKATILGPGGHSWSAFGLANPHHAMAKALNLFSDEAARFTSSGIKTSFNVGRTGGGTSVNSIPFESWAEVDMRSESPSSLTKIDSIFKACMTQGVADYNVNVKKGPELTLQLERIGYRPSGTTLEKEPIVQRAMAAVKYFNLTPQLGIVSTNANIPISYGIPAITLGYGGKSSNTHSLNEWWFNEKGADGIKFILLNLLLEAGVSNK